jgi:hypothetical protein
MTVENRWLHKVQIRLGGTDEESLSRTVWISHVEAFEKLGSRRSQ